MTKRMFNLSKILHCLFVLLQICMAICIVISLLSQGKRFIKSQHHVFTPEELRVDVIHFNSKKYVSYEKKPEEDTEFVLLCVGETACYWKNEDIEKYVVDNAIDTSITELTFSVKRHGLDKWIHTNNTVTYVKYGCQEDDTFSDEEVDYYAELAARRFTYETYSAWGFKDADAYKDFVVNENRY